MLNTTVNKTTNNRNIFINASERLPEYVFNNVLSFFNGTPTAIAIHKHEILVRRALKTEINNRIKKAISRTNMHQHELVDGEYNGEHWAFGFGSEDENLQLQACNCKKCGNYNYPLSFEHTDRIMCYC